MRVGFLGSGAWGMILANLIAKNGYEVLLWSIEEDVITALEQGEPHPRFPDYPIEQSIRYTRDLKKAIDCDAIVECVTAKGARPVMEEIAKLGGIKVPFILTSKGIEQGSGKLLVEIAYEVLGIEEMIGYMSGPTLAGEVKQEHPTAAVAAGKTEEMVDVIKKLFGGPYFRIYESRDVKGVALGGAIKNVIAIACGFAEGMGFGYNTKAMLIVRGLQEMVRVSAIKGGQEDTCYGLAGIGDLIVTGMSDKSRNFKFGTLLGKGLSIDEAKKEVGMVVEGAYTVKSATDLGKKFGLELPIAYGMYEVIYESADRHDTLKKILERDVKNELE